MKFTAEWFLTGKVHKKTQVALGFFRGGITCRQLTRFTRQTFSKHDDAELYALELMLRWKAIFDTQPPPVLPKMEERNLGEGM